MTTFHELKIRHVQKLQQETVLVMQGGGSLGAYECGVYKRLTQHGIKFDIVAGTSIGAINAGIIAGSRGDPVNNLENFWLDMVETVTPSILPDSLRCIVASSYTAAYGNAKAFAPVWLNGWSNSCESVPSFSPSHWNYLYESAPLKNTLRKYIDFSKLNDQNTPRLIVTCTDVQRSEPVSFDSMLTNIDADHIVACAGFPFYGIKWTKIGDRYLWDGALLSNTPLREVIGASPKKDKKVYIADLFPHIQEELPQNMVDVWHRARDIMNTDRTDNNVRMSKAISHYLLLLREMHDIISNAPLDEELHKRFRKIEQEYHKLADERGAIIDEITKIERTEDVRYILEDTDFSIATIKKQIKQGEEDTERALVKKRVEITEKK
jgi:NTE family protein